MPHPDARRDAPTAIVAEDEPMLADELVEQLAALWPQLQVVTRATDGVAALHAVEEHAPNIAFLDIHMPRLTGLDVARQISKRCHVAFITAFDQHALEAFEAGALDYVLKPVTPARLLTTVQRLKARMDEAPPDLGHLLEQIAPRIHRPATSAYLQWIKASRGAALRLITVDEILYFRADNKYTVVATADSEALIRKSIKELAEELDPTMFWQVHRSSVVNVHAIDSVVRDDRGNMTLRLKGRSETLPVAEQYNYLFRQM
jgi:DNA-binding LytR/AlgR family response regulator